jgi:hypothetical protein
MSLELFAAAPAGRRAGNPLFASAREAAARGVTPLERASVLRELGQYAGGTLSRLGSALSAPDDYFRGLVLGRPGERVDGRGLLRELGLAGQDDNWGNFTAGLATDVLTSPTTYLLGPAAALSPAGQAAKKLGLLDNAATVATKNAISSGAATEALPMVAQRTKKALESTGRTMSTFDPAVVGRPLYGTRTARRAVTLDDLIRNADDPVAAEQAARRLLGGQFDAVRGDTLSRSFGIGAPIGDPLAVGDWLGKGFGDRYADVLDTVGQAARWSYPGRVASAAFNQKVGGTIDAEGQITNIADFMNRQKKAGTAVSSHTYHLAKLNQAHPDVFTEEGNRRLGRYIEGVGTPEDANYVLSRPELKAYADWAKDNFSMYLEESRKLGLPAAELKDKYGIEYLPRRADPALEMQARKDRKLAGALSVFTGDAMSRTAAMQVPGGRDTIIQLSQDTVVSGAKRSASNDTEAGQHILGILQARNLPGQPKPTLRQAVKIARVLNQLPDEVVKKSPLFGQHPVEMIESYMRSRGEAMGTAETLYDSLATFVAEGDYRSIPGGRHTTLDDALNRLGLRSYDDEVAGGAMGAKQQMRERIAKLRGIDPDDVRLNEYSVPIEHVDRLAKARDAFSVDEASGDLLNRMDHLTQAWKGSILTWPSRAVRDLYSGAFQNWLAGASDIESISAAKALITEGPGSPSFRRFIAQIGRYAGDDSLSQFYADLSATGLYQGPAAFEHGGSTFGSRALQQLPGSEPITVGGILGELAPQSGRSWGQFGQDFMNWRSALKPLAETTNPVLRAGEKMNSMTDGINRISGYLALLKKGYEPQAAADAIKRVQVDYSTLTAFEKSYLKRLFPWYSFNSRIFQEVLGQLAERPGGRFGQLIRATEAIQDEGDEDTYIPSGLRSQFAFPLPESWGGKSGDAQVYLTDLDLPGFDQINYLETPGTVGGAIRGTGRQIAMQTHPLVRGAIELATGRDLFTNRPAAEATSALDVLARRVTGDPYADVPSIIDKPAEMVPFVGRPLNLMRSLLDDRGGQPLRDRAIKTLINATTGVKVRPVAEEDVLADAIRQIEESIDPFTREYSRTYIPESLMPTVPPWVLQRLAVSDAMGKDRKAIRDRARPKPRTNTGALGLFE